MVRISLHHAFVALVAGILLAGMVPGWIVLDRRLSRAIESQAREHVAMAPALLADRESMASAMAIMHARELSGTPGLAQAVRVSARDRALELLAEAASNLPEAPLLLVGYETWAGTLSDTALVAATRDGAEFHAIVPQNGALIRVALVPLFDDGLWLGAVGVTDQLGNPTAGVLAGLTLSDVIVLPGPGGGLRPPPPATMWLPQLHATPTLGAVMAKCTLCEAPAVAVFSLQPPISSPPEPSYSCATSTQN